MSIQEVLCLQMSKIALSCVFEKAGLGSEEVASDEVEQGTQTDVHDQLQRWTAKALIRPY